MEEIIRWMESKLGTQFHHSTKISVAKKFLRYRLKMMEWAAEHSQQEIEGEIERLKGKLRGGRVSSENTTYRLPGV